MGSGDSHLERAVFVDPDGSSVRELKWLLELDGCPIDPHGIKNVGGIPDALMADDVKHPNSHAWDVDVVEGATTNGQESGDSVWNGVLSALVDQNK